MYISRYQVYIIGLKLTFRGAYTKIKVRVGLTLLIIIIIIIISIPSARSLLC